MSGASPGRTTGGRSARSAFWRDLVVLFVAAAALSAIGSWHVSLWYDEAATISAARRSWPDLFRLAGNTNAVQGVYYALMHLWSDVAGTSPFAWRFPSALAVGGTAVGTAVLARFQLRRPVALLAGAVVAVLPRMTWAGIEARPYALTALVAVWLTVVALRASRAGRHPGRWWVGYGVLAVVGVGLYVYLALLIVAHGLVVWTSRTARASRWGVAIAALGAVALSAPVWWVAAHQTSQLGIDRRLTVPTLVRSLVVNEWFLGDTPTPVSATLRAATDSSFTTVWTAGAIGLAVLGWVLAVIGLGTRPGEGPVDLRWWLVSWLVLPAIVIGVYSVAVSPMYVPRYLTFAAPALAILIARGAAVLVRRAQVVGAVALVLAAVLAAPVYVSQRTAFAKNSTDWSALAEYMRANARPGDAVYYAPLRESTIENPGGPTLRQAQVAYPQAFAGLRDLTIVRSAADAGSLVATSQPLADGVDRLDGVDTVWVIRRRDEPADAEANADQVLTDAGFRGGVVYEGPMDVIERFSRS